MTHDDTSLPIQNGYKKMAKPINRADEVEDVSGPHVFGQFLETAFEF